MENLTIIKIALIGNIKVGKTSLIDCFLNKNIEKNYKSSEKIKNCYLKKVNLSEDNQNRHECILKIQDLIGLNSEILKDEKEKNFVYDLLDNFKIENLTNGSSLGKNKKNIFGFLFVFDLNDKQSFIDSLEYYKEILKKENEKNLKNLNFLTKKIFVGTKNDLVKKENQEEILYYREFIKNMNVKFFETSSVDFLNVNEVFEEICRDIYYDAEIENFERNEKLRVKKIFSLELGEENLKKEEKKNTNNFLNFFKRLKRGDDKQSNSNIETKFSLEEFEKCEYTEIENFSLLKSKNKECNIF